MFPEILTEARSLVLERINSLISAESKVSNSMLYTSTAESKMIRSALLIAASKKNASLTKSSAINLATSIELLHSYSLIHDDLPSMDNDNIRRGKDSNHIKYGEAIAILSGDALQTLAFEVITNDHNLDSDLKVSAISLLTDACGYKGMVLGQELNSSGGFTGTPTRYGKYIPSIGQNIYNAGNQAIDFGIDSGSARFACVGYAYISDSYGARFIPYLLMFDEDGGNFNHASPYVTTASKSGYAYGVYVDGSHNAYVLQGFNDPTTVITPAVVHKYNSSAVSQSHKAYRADGTGFTYFSHGAEDSSGNLYFAGGFNMNHDSVDNITRAGIIKFNSSLVPQWYRAIDVEPADASSTRYSQTSGLQINSDGNICWSFLTGNAAYQVGGVAVLPADGSGTGTYSIDGHTLDYIDISSKITDVTSNFSFSNASRFSTYNNTLASLDTLTPEQNGGSNVPASITAVEV